MSTARFCMIWFATCLFWGPTFAMAQCDYSCGGKRAHEMLTHALSSHSIDVFVSFDQEGSAPSWIDPSWRANHLDAACYTWSSSQRVILNPKTIPAGGSTPKIEVFFYNNYDGFHTWPFGDALAVAVEMTTDYWMIQVNVSDSTHRDSAWWDEAGQPSSGPNPPWDMQSVFLHELGHCLGLHQLLASMVGCSVMAGTYAGVRRSPYDLDWNAIACDYPTVSVADIHSFSATSPQNGHHVDLAFELVANQTQTPAVYVSDNPIGPAQYVSLINCPGALIPTINTCIDTYRLAPAEAYYYWLDHDNGGFAPIRDPYGLFAAPSGLFTSPQPVVINASTPGLTRPIYDEPEVTSIQTASGGAMTVTWQLSQNDASLDWYNIYRNSYPNGLPQQGEWRWLGKVQQGTAPSFTDLSPPVGRTVEYMVSAAHHGSYSVTSGSGNAGIWNEFSATAEAVSGVIYANCTWSGQVFVSGDIRVAQGATLTVNPGTAVYVWPSDPNSAVNTGPAGADPSRCEIWVDGTIRAIGSQSQPIKFVAYDASGPTTDNDAWYGFYVTASGNATFKYCTIKNARYGIGAQGDVTLRNSLIQYAQQRGVSAAYSSDVSIRNTTIRDVDVYGINLSQYATLHIAQSTVKNVGIYGIQVASGSAAYVDTVTCRDNVTAIYINRDSPSYTVSATIRGSTISHNDNGIYVTNEMTGVIRYCTIDSNTTTGVYLYATVGGVFGGTRLERNKIRHNVVGVYVDGGNPLIQNSNVIESNTAGLKCDHDAVPIVRGSKIASNTEGVLAINNGLPDLGVCGEDPCDTTACSSSGKNNISANTGYHIMNVNGMNPIAAICNYWGTKVTASKFWGDVIYEPHLGFNPLPGLVAPLVTDPEGARVPRAFEISQNYPNPFNPATTIRYSVPTSATRVEISIFDVGGRRVTTLVEGQKMPGEYEATWDGRSSRGEPVASGIYFVRMHAGQFEKTRKLVLLK